MTSKEILRLKIIILFSLKCVLPNPYKILGLYLLIYIYIKHKETIEILSHELIKAREKKNHGLIADECKTHLCFEFISHAILCILYPYSCKTHKISSKLGFVELLMKSK